MDQIEKVLLSEEQNLFIEKALEGENILVDACIGSGKTTSIQKLCDKLGNKMVLYLTYNKLLKIDAKKKILNRNVMVQNYHGFAYLILKRIGVSVGQSDLIQQFLKYFYDGKIRLPPYDVLIIDEYQDIDEEISHLLETIKLFNPFIQIIAVGDMKQKIYDKTKLDVESFIEEFLGKHTKLEFTRCFRLSEKIANKMGRIWSKKIKGVNKKCLVKYMTAYKVVKYLSKKNPEDILCLGKNNGIRDNYILNELEEKYNKKFNKYTVFAKISDNDSQGMPNKDLEKINKAAIFTTYDSSKGLERKICVVCDFTEIYWDQRMRKAGTNYSILRNIFCVAASRGKERIIFVKNNDDNLLSERTLSTNCNISEGYSVFEISNMFDFKFKEDIEECYYQLEISKIKEKNSSEISIKNSDGLIDLSPCIGVYQEAMFFTKYNIDDLIKDKLITKLIKNKKGSMNDDYLRFTVTREVERNFGKIKKLTLNEKILYYTALETDQNRYSSQVRLPFITLHEEKLIRNRLKELFDVNEEVQRKCKLIFLDKKDNGNILTIYGRSDVIKNNIVYELKFVDELTHEHFLQCASYMIAHGLEKGILWNTRDNSKYDIKIPDRTKFFNSVIRTITKGVVEKYYEPPKEPSFKRKAFYMDEISSQPESSTNDWEDEYGSVKKVKFYSQG